MRGGWFNNPSELAADHDPTQLLGHYVVSRGPTVAPSAWPRREHAGWTLQAESTLPVVDLLDAGRRPLGWLLGHAIDTERRVVLAGSVTLPFAAEPAGFEERFEEWLYAHAGRYAAIVFEPQAGAFVDAYGSLPLLFEPGARRLSSSPFLLVDPGGTIPDSPLIRAIDPYGTSGYYPFAETCHAGAFRLLPSHVLDVDTFTQRRTWPRGPFEPTTPEQAVERIGSLVEATIAGAASAAPLALGLTGGGDSRLMLACARPLAHDLLLHTVPHADMVGAHDAATAARIARELGLPWREVPWVECTDADVRLWFYRTGALAGESRGRRCAPTFEQLAADGKRLCISGVGVELARGYAWSRNRRRGEPRDTPEKKLSGADLLARINLSRDPIVAAAADRWLADVPGLNALDTIDLCALETTHGAWASILTLGYPDAFSAVVYPFANRAIFEAFFGLPHAYRKSDALRRDVVARRWPELGAYPINRISRRLQLAEKAYRVAQAPGGAVRRARRRRLQRNENPNRDYA